MKYIKQPLTIEEGEGFTKDRLNRLRFGESLKNLVTTSEDALVISVDGDWGEGKTTFVRMWQGLLTESDIPSIYIDAFENDYIDDAFIAITSSIYDYVQKNLPKEKTDEFKETAKNAGTRLLSWGTKLGIKAVTLGIIRDSEIEELQDIKNDISKGTSNFLGKAIEDRINAFSSDKENLISFRETLSSLAERGGTGSDKPLVIIIDELDRCKPSFAIDLIEKIKHLFSVKNVHFLLVVNKKQLEESIRSVYGKIDAHTYLQKFIHIESVLPKYTEKGSFNNCTSYIRDLFSFHDLKLDEKERDITTILEFLCHYYNLTLRQLEKAFTNLSIYYGTLPKGQLDNSVITTFLAVIKVTDPDLFHEILRKKVGYNQVIQRLSGLSNEDKRMSNNIARWIKYSLMPDEEFQRLPNDHEIRKMSGIYYSYSYIRTDLMSTPAQRMSMFNIIS